MWLISHGTPISYTGLFSCSCFMALLQSPFIICEIRNDIQPHLLEKTVNSVQLLEMYMSIITCLIWQMARPCALPHYCWCFMRCPSHIKLHTLASDVTVQVKGSVTMSTNSVVSLCVMLETVYQNIITNTE